MKGTEMKKTKTVDEWPHVIIGGEDCKPSLTRVHAICVTQLESERRWKREREREKIIAPAVSL